MNTVHLPSYRLNTLLYFLFLGLGIWIWILLPDRIPIKFDFDGNPTKWAENKHENLILLFAICTFSFWKLHLFQRYLLNDPDSSLLNIPYKKQFLKLPIARKQRVMIRLNRMMGKLNTGMLLIYMFILAMMYYTAVQPDSFMLPLANYSLILVIVLSVVFPVTEYFGIKAMIRQKLQEEGLYE